MVPQPHEQTRRRESPGPRWRFPGPGEHYQPRTVCADGHALWPAQTPPTGGPRGSGESWQQVKTAQKYVFQLSQFILVSYKANGRKKVVIKIVICNIAALLLIGKCFFLIV